eukprot:s1_g2177.t1
MATELNADFVIVGSGAIGMAFADIIMTESDATMIIIDRYAKPGGHWNVAYPFVQLHQPSSFYGVSSKELSGGRIEQGGLNDGLGELASGAEVSAYFDDVMRHQFLPSGRVQYFPMCDYQGDGKFVSKASGEVFHATANRKIVDATYLKTSVPSTHTPNFEVEDGVRFMPLNDLPKVEERPDAYIVVGAGKTGIDACLWLLENGVDPDLITWIVSRDAWLLDRRNTQITQEFFYDTIGSYAAQMESIANATSIDDMFDRLEQSGYFVRIDPETRPTMFHGATISQLELKALRQIKNVVRNGHVTSIGANEIKMDRGTIPTTPNTLHIDCSATAVKNDGVIPVFNGDTIVPQMIRPYQPVFSAAMIAHVELYYDDEAQKNRLCAPVPLPDGERDYIDFTLGSLINQLTWSQDRDLSEWISTNRLDGASKLIAGIGKEEQQKWDVVSRIQTNAPRAAEKLVEFQKSIS